VRYLVGPFDGVYVETLVADFTAGITVALTLIPQGRVLIVRMFGLLLSRRESLLTKSQILRN
jgi:hypothetical protein